MRRSRARSARASRTSPKRNCSRYRSPPWIRRDDRDEVPAAMSSCSMRAARRPRVAASRRAPAPTIPPPTIDAGPSVSSASRERRPRAAAARRTRPEDDAVRVDRIVRRAAGRGDPPEQPGGADDEHGDRSGALKIGPGLGSAGGRDQDRRADDDRDDRGPRRGGPRASPAGTRASQPRSASGGIPIGATRTLPRMGGAAAGQRGRSWVDGR